MAGEASVKPGHGRFGPLKQIILAIALVGLWSAPVRADQIDVVLKFASLAAAKADPVVQQHRDAIADLFAGDRVIPNLKVWRASQDVAGADAEGNPTVTHNYLAGWYMLVSLESGRVPNALRDHAAVQVAINRDKASARQVGAIIRSTVGAVVLQDIRFEPVFSGSDPPWGAWQ